MAKAVIETDKGNIVLELFDKEARTGNDLSDKHNQFARKD